DELPDLFVAQRTKRRHLRAWHARSNAVKDVAVVVAVHERSRGERRRAVALTCRAVARLTGLIVNPLAVGDSRWIRRQWISRRVCGRLTREKHASAQRR